MKTILLAALAVCTLGASASSARPFHHHHVMCTIHHHHRICR